MKQRAMFAVFGCLVLLAGAGKPHSQELLKLQVSPLVSQAPGFVNVRTIVDVSDDNRALEISAVSPDFSRSSTIELSGRSGPAVNTFSYPNLPAGEYEVRAVLIGANGVRATVARTARVVPRGGS
jgi:hypothetical protein